MGFRLILALAALCQASSLTFSRLHSLLPPSISSACPRVEILAPLLLSPSLLLLPPPASAAPPEMRFTGTYDDLLHPSCVRMITVVPTQAVDAKSRKVKVFRATFRGTDVGPAGIGDKVMLACDEESIKKYGLREFEFEGRIEGGSVDAGDGIHEGEYASVKDGDSFEGIRWKDGNRWIKKPNVDEP